MSRRTPADPVQLQLQRGLARAQADAERTARERAAMGLASGEPADEAEAKLAERRELEDAERRHRELFGDPRLRAGDANLPVPERKNRKARRAEEAALRRLALPQAKRGRRAGGRAAEALIAAQAPGKAGRD